MAGRRLSRQQIERIRTSQQRRRQRVAHAAAPSEDTAALGAEQTGTVLAHHGSRVLIEDGDSVIHGCVPRQNLGSLVAGDRIVWQTAEGGDGVIVARLPRETVLQRPDAGGRLRTMAANVDRLLVVIGADADPNDWQLDRFLVAGEHAGIAPVIVINKVDRLDAAARSALAERLGIYPELGYPLVFTSTHQEGGLDALLPLLPGQTCVFVGQSGVGKSSLINAVVPAAEARVGTTSEATGKGRHTTTTARLYRLPGGGSLIDSPGVREFGLVPMSGEAVAEAFPEFRDFLGGCRFRDCRHLADEPGCALAAACAAGHIERRRLESYRRIIEFFTENPPASK